MATLQNGFPRNRTGAFVMFVSPDFGDQQYNHKYKSKSVYVGDIRI